jgi:hypothetical protein
VFSNPFTNPNLTDVWTCYENDNHIAASQIGILGENLKHVLQFGSFANPISALPLHAGSTTSVEAVLN